ncbi:cupin domain-containing protein [Roseomonas indoligenes]|uniref:Cupin domain-containing protein n=1 Tax=Roseomonas indoligenes TaxID=2820811 RepID=A0A940MWJ2_9PROT|nr:cupin domain-containing protein [Pararoseomonas indoligenes]MBP0495528.1 cupin domain-containing protein [Pararoseomonas indoligenes]
MNVTRFDAAQRYEAPGHFDMRMFRLQGREAGPSDTLWMGLSWLLPGGHTTLDASPIEKHYVVVEGELTVVAEIDGRQEEATLGRLDSCRIAPGEGRKLENRTNRPAAVLLAMPLRPAIPG